MKTKRKISLPRPERLIALDLETNTIHQVEELCVYQNWIEMFSRHYGETVQPLSTVKLFITNR